MTKISIVCLAGMLFFASCENSESSTVGTYEKDETPATSEKQEETTHEAGSNKDEDLKETSTDSSANSANIESKKADTASKKDTSVSLLKKSVKPQSKTIKTGVSQ